MSVRIGFAGTFDMLTEGHMWVIEQAYKITPEVVIFLPENPTKKPSEPVAIRQQLLQRVLKERNISARVEVIHQEYTANAAKRFGIDYMVRGIRKSGEFDYEKEVHEANLAIAGIPTMFLVPPPDKGRISSSFVKGLMSGSPLGWHWEVKKLVPKEVYERLRANWLKVEWDSVWDDGTSSTPRYITEKQSSLFSQLMLRYTEPKRYYHNLDHIVHMLSEINTWARYNHPTDNQLRALKLATWFHDYVQTPGHKGEESDEMLSAQFWLDQDIPAFRHGNLISNHVYQLILSTNHFERKHVSPAYQEVIIGADLAILGQAPEIYDAYAMQVRNEYSMFNDKQYYEGRYSALMSLTETDQLFEDPYFFNRYQVQAMDNMHREMDRIKRMFDS